MASRRKSRTQARAERRRAAQAVIRIVHPIEQRYARGLRVVAKSWAGAYERALKPFLKDRAERTDAELRSLPNTFDVLGMQVHAALEPSVGPLFDRMSRDVQKATARTSRLLGISANDIGLRGFVDQKRNENIALVENAHRVYARQVRELFEDPSNDGMRVETLAKRLLERGDVSESRAALIARDQTLKLNGQLAQERMQTAGVEGYVWSTSLDERVREEHQALEGQTFTWDNPPEVGHPGQDFQCRCVAIPVVSELEGLF